MAHLTGLMLFAAFGGILHDGRYYCVTIERLEQLLKQAGFKQVILLHERFFQPLIISTKQQSFQSA